MEKWQVFVKGIVERVAFEVKWYNYKMKNLWLMGVVILIIVIVNHFTKQPQAESEILIQKDIPSVRPTNTQVKMADVKEIAALFVPYWSPTVSREIYAGHDRFIYFGVSPTKEGKLSHDTAYNSIGLFRESTRGKKQYLTLRMLNAETNFAILEDSKVQKTLIEETLRLAKENDFDGIVLDLELSTIPLSEVASNITLFVQQVGQATRNDDLHFAMTMYGDTYFRGRPYDVKTIGSEVDELMIMAYDFHKSRGEPGPNFPLGDREKYGYDLQTMFKDFTRDVPPEKLTVLFGMYGYDWTLGPQGKPLKVAKAIPLRDIRPMIEPCSYQNCRLNTNDSREQVLKYTDDGGYAHELWFEDEKSVAKKIEYLKSQNVGSIGYWVNGYW